MKLIRLGDYIEQVDKRNKDNQYKNVMGISVNKILIPTKANTNNIDLKSYKILEKGYFAYCLVTSRNGNKISIVYNDIENCVISAINPVFKIRDERIINPYFLFMYFKRTEFDRYARFNSWGSARETFDWNDFCDIKIELPSIEIQNKYVAIYKAMQDNLKVYQSKLDDLEITYTGYIENLKKNSKLQAIEPYIKRGIKNTDEKIDNVIGIGQRGFIKPQKKPNESLKNYKIIKKGSICYAPPMYNIKSGAIHLYRENDLVVCSPIYEVFECDETNLSSNYLILWLRRKSFVRYADFYSLGVRNTFDYNLMEEVKIPIPSIEIQNDIALIYNELSNRKKILENIKYELSNICPILVKGAIQEGEKEKNE